MRIMIEIHDYCDEKFLAVREAFLKNFEEGLELLISIYS